MNNAMRYLGIAGLALLCALNNSKALSQQPTTTTMPQKALSKEAQTAFDEAYALGQKGQFDKALTRYEEAVKLAPEYADCWMEYGLCLRNTFHLQRSVQATWRAIELGDASSGVWGNLGNTYLKARSWTAARAAYDKAEALSDDKQWAARNYLNLGYEQWLSGENDAALASYQQALKIDPHNVQGLLDIACVHAAQGKASQALDEIEKAKPLLDTTKGKIYQMQLAYVQNIQAEIKARGKLTPPESLNIFERLPGRFLALPEKGKALSVEIDAKVTKFFQFPKIGILTILVPEAWNIQLDTKGIPNASTIIFTPASGDNFTLMWTPMPGPAQSLAALKATLEAGGKGNLSEAVEKELTIKEITSSSMQGYYYQLTDKSSVGKPPQKGDYPYVLSCMLKAGQTSCTLTVLSRTNDPQFLKEITDVIASISAEPKIASSQPK